MRPKTNLMVIDDEPAMQGLLRDFLVSQGYAVTCLSSAEAAVRSLRDNKQNYSAIVSDIRMVPMSGIELLKLTIKEHPYLPVLLFTSAGTPEERQEVLQLGAAAYLFKPFSLSELKRQVEATIELYAKRKRDPGS